MSFPKPEPLKRTKARKARTEAKVIAQVKLAVMERDGSCRMAVTGVGACAGVLDWAHLPQWRRSATRGKPATERHTTQGTVLLCRKHHEMLDGQRAPRMFVEHGPDGADGLLKWICGGTIVRERRTA